MSSTTANEHSQPDQAAEDRARNLTHHGVVVGIDHYPSYTDLKPLRYARKDAKAFYDWLVDPERGSVPPNQVCYITPTDEEVAAFRENPQSVWPTLERVAGALGKAAMKVNGLRDTDPDGWQRSRLWFFAAGHGIAPSTGQVALLMANVTEGMLGFNIELGEYAGWYQRCSPFAEVILLADCCRTYRPEVPGWGPPFTQCFTLPDRTTILLGFAAGFGDPAYEPGEDDPDDGRGYFTAALLDGLNGHAADPRTHQVTATLLKQYVEEQVLLRSQAKRRQQRAELKPLAGQDLVLTTVAQIPDASEYDVTFAFGPGKTGTAVLYEPDLVTPIGRWAGRDGPWHLSLPMGLYELRYEAEPPRTVRVDGDVDVQL